MDSQSLMGSFVVGQDKDKEIRPSSSGSWACKEVDEFDAL